MTNRKKPFPVRYRLGPIITICITMLITPASQAGVRAMLDRNTIYEGDTVTLTIEADGSDQDASPDLSVLEKDFKILGTGSSRQIRIVNGQRSDKHQWQVELDPKHSGEIGIPAIPVGKASTNALTLAVTEPPTTGADLGGQPVFLQMEISDSGSKPFVQQQVRLGMRLFYRVSLVDGSFDDPQPENAVVERLGSDRQYQTDLDGQSYQVIERRYAIFPEKSGPLTIPAVNFTGRVAAGAAQRRSSNQIDSMLDRFFTHNPFGDPGKRIRVRSKPLTLDVEARPKAYRGRYWLPSDILVLEDSWVENPPEFRAGEPVTRTISLRAKGLESSQLPDIEVPTVEHMRIYPEQAVVENRTDGDWIFGTRQQEFAYVPSRAGHFTLPEIRVDWWDTANGKAQTAIIPAWEINVLPGAGGSTAPVTPVPGTADTKEDDAKQPGGTVAKTVHGTGTEVKTWLQTWWPSLIIGAVVIGLLRVTSRRNRRSSPAEHVHPSPATHTRVARRALQQACEQNDPQAAAHALLDWASGQWPDDQPRSLGLLAQRIDRGVEQVQALDRVLYAADQHYWQGKALWDVFSGGLVKKVGRRSTGDDHLAPLYPHRQHAQT